jgi:hypothetical protein
MAPTITAEAAGTFTLRDRRKLKRINRRTVRTQRKAIAARDRQWAATLHKASMLAAAQLRASREQRCERRSVAEPVASHRSSLAPATRSRRHSGRQEARPAHHASAASGCGGGRKRGGDGSAGGDPPDGDEPSDDAGDDPSEGEIGRLAALVGELFPDALRATQFEAAVGTLLLDLDADAGYEARVRIYADLPVRLRMSMLGDVLTRAAALRGLHPDGCRCCCEPFDRLEFVDEDGDLSRLLGVPSA